MDEIKEENSGMPEKVIGFSNSDDTLTNKMRENPWILATFVLGVLTLILFVASLGGITGSVITGNVVSEDVVNDIFLKSLETQGANLDDITITDVSLESGMYKISFDYQGEPFPTPFYVSKDGKFIGNMNPISQDSVSDSNSDSVPTSIPKSDKPVVELFVMSYCPYGTQAEKGVIPVVRALGDSIDFKLRFVSYLMHGEKEAEENLRDYCIQKLENKDKFLDYMECFLEGDGVVNEQYGLIMEGKDSVTCMNKLSIDVNAVENCMVNTDEEFDVTDNLNSGDRYPRFNIEADLNSKYGIQGSPSLVVNGVQIPISSDSRYYEFNDKKIPFSRSPSTYLSIICSLFEDAPETCGTLELSSTNPTAYFGWDESADAGSSAGMC